MLSVVNPCIVFNTQPMLRSVHKDALASYHFSSIIYNFKYQCDYISRTTQRLEKRINQHVPASIHKGQFSNLYRCMTTFISVIEHLINNNSLLWRHVFSSRPAAFKFLFESIESQCDLLFIYLYAYILI